MSHSNNANGNSPHNGPGDKAWIETRDDAWEREPAREGGKGTRRAISLQAVLRYKWWALALFVVLAVPGATLAWMANKPLYKGKATVEVSPMIPRIVYDTEQSGIIPLYEQYLNDQVMVLRSPTVLERVLDDGDVQKTRWYRNPPETLIGSAPSNLERLREEVKAGVRPRTSFVDVHLTGPNPKEAALIVNAVVDEYLKFINEKAQRFDDDVYKVLSEEYNSLQATIDGIKSIVAELRNDLLTANPEELQAQQRQRLDARVAELEEARRATALAEWQADQMRGLLPTVSDAAAEQGVPYALDTEWRGYFMELKSAEHEVAARSGMLGEDNQEMVALHERVAFAQKRLEIRQQQLDEIYATNPGALLANGSGGRSLEQQLAGHERHVKQLKFEEQLRAATVQRELDRLEKTSASADMLSKELDKLRHAEQRFEDVRQRKVAMEVERRAPASIRIQDRAFPPSQASNTNRRWALVALAIAAALAGAGGLTLLRVVRNPAVEMPEELSAVAAPFLGRLPWVCGQDDPEFLSAAQAECARMVRTALLERLGEGPARALQITSANIGAGKTSALVLLGESLGRCGKRVLLVDADRHRPALHQRLGIENGAGFSDVLRGLVDDATAIQVCPGNPHVHVLPAGETSATDEELLSGQVLDQCLAEWRLRYDIILFDGPPLLPVADARILARRVDGNLFVIREGCCRRNEVTDALLGLSGSGGSLLGIIFFGRGRGSGYYGYGYGYGESNGYTNGHERLVPQPANTSLKEAGDEVHRGAD